MPGLDEEVDSHTIARVNGSDPWAPPTFPETVYGPCAAPDPEDVGVGVGFGRVTFAPEEIL